MRVIYLKRNRLAKVGIIAVLTLLFIGLPYTHFRLLQNYEEPVPPRPPLKAKEVPSPLGSNSIRIPIFLAGNRLGNFEPKLESHRRMGPGEGGQPHKLSSSQRVKEDELKDVYGFNQLVSDEISLDRSIPDLRVPECQSWDYPTDLPTASVILVFHNEGWSTLLRTVHSVLNRSPPQFLKEIVLVDDKSELKHLHEPLETEIRKPYYQNKILLVRNKEREGLIRSRNNGALAASGQVVIFLDAHCEVENNWLPPLLAPIRENDRTLSVPIIDGINWDDFSISQVYAKGSHSRGLFEWGMLYKEGTLPSKEEAKRKYHSEPYNAPTHAGGLFAISREWFKELGWYDQGLYVWGGENFELSFKTWMCGGRSVWVPCSRVAHVYRGHSCSSCHSGSLSHKFQGPTTLRNYKRVIETWFDDEYKEYFYTREPLARFLDMGDISEPLSIKKKLNCKSFDWFMKEIAYDVFDAYPRLPPNLKWGTVKNKNNNLCLDTQGHHPQSKTVLRPCHSFGGNQLFRLNTKGQLTNGEWCQEMGTDGKLGIRWCQHGSVSGPWTFNDDTNQLFHTGQSLCLTLENEEDLILRDCDSNNSKQIWTWNTIKPYWAKV